MNSEHQLQLVHGAQRGFTLVELMVALLIGLIVTLGASQLFITSKRSFDQVEELAQRQETLRFLVDTLSLDIRTAKRDGITIGGDDDILTLLYSDSRENDPYCPAGEKLTRVEYTFDAETASIKVGYTCSNEPPVDPQPLVSGVAGINFSTGGGGLNYVDVLLRFLPLGNEPANDREVTFRVANRNSVIK